MEINNKTILIYKKHKKSCFMKFVVEDTNNKIIDKLLGELNDVSLSFISLGNVIIDKSEISYIEMR